MSAKQYSLVLMLMTAFLWSLAGVFIKIIDWDPLAIVCTRSLVATIVMYLFIRKQKFQWSWAMLGAALSYACFTYCIILSTKLTTSANAVILQYTAPIYVAFLSGILLKEHIRKADWLCLAAVIAGMWLFFMDQISGGSVLGNLIGIGNGVSFAFLSIFLRFQKNGHPEQSVFIGGLIAFLIGIPFTINHGIPAPKDILVIIIAGVVVSIGYRLFTEASKHLSALQSVMLPIIDPLLNPLWVFLAVGEKPSLISLFGGIIILCAITIRSLMLMREPNPSRHSDSFKTE